MLCSEYRRVSVSSSHNSVQPSEKQPSCCRTADQNILVQLSKSYRGKGLSPGGGRHHTVAGTRTLLNTWGINKQIYFQASNTKDLKLLNARQVLELVPFSPSIKSTLLDLIMSVSNPILGDWSVIVHMTMLFIFGAHNYDTADLIVQNINKQLWTMLRRHLTNTMSCQASVNSSMAHIHHCIQTLPTMLEVHKDVLNKFV